MNCELCGVVHHHQPIPEDEAHCGCDEGFIPARYPWNLRDCDCGCHRDWR